MIERLFVATAIKTSEFSIRENCKIVTIKNTKRGSLPLLVEHYEKALFFNVSPIIFLQQVSKHKENKDKDEDTLTNILIR
jgi:hypothetical protein